MLLDPKDNPFTDMLLDDYGIVGSMSFSNSNRDSVESWDWYLRGCPAGESYKRYKCVFHVDGHSEVIDD